MAMIVSCTLHNQAFEQIMQLKECLIIELVSGRKKVVKTSMPLLKHETKPIYHDYYCYRAIGIKAGKNANSKQCVVSCVKIGDNYIAAVILGANDYEYNRFSFIDIARMLRKSL